jgi:hypothetical protein
MHTSCSCLILEVPVQGRHTSDNVPMILPLIFSGQLRAFVTTPRADTIVRLPHISRLWYILLNT